VQRALCKETRQPDKRPSCNLLLFVYNKNYSFLRKTVGERMTAETIDHNTLSRLVEAGAVRAAHVIGQLGGWGVVIKYGMTERPLAASRSREVRLFKKLETVVSYLKEIGISRFDVDSVNYDAAQLKTYSRPDRAEAMRQAHEAAAHDKWFRAQVQQGLDDARPTVAHADVMADLRTTIERVAAGHGANRAG
jgi:hypothetical protein